VPALLSSNLAAQNGQSTPSGLLGSNQVLSLTPQTMRASWESLTWAGSTGQALTVDVGRAGRLVAWEKAQYLPCWEIQEKLWFFSEFLETAGAAAVEHGSYEPLSDKRNRYTHVAITELGPARIVLHWQYALTDSTEQANIFHGNTWAEEFHVVYPDGLTVRRLIGYPGDQTTVQGQPLVWEVAEMDLVFAPGSRLRETIDMATALRVGSTNGELYTLSWPSSGERWLCRRAPQSCNWPAYVFRPTLRRVPEPFLVVPHRKDYFPRIACGACGGDHLSVLLWLAPGVYKKWPGCSGECPKVAQGTEEDMKLQATHMPFVSVIPWVHPNFLKAFLSEADHSLSPSNSVDSAWSPKRGTTWLMLYGTSQENDQYLSDLAEQWVEPPELKMVEGESVGFAPAENLYQISPGRGRCSFRLSPAENHRLIHPTFKVLNWSYRPARVSLNDLPLAPDRWRGSWIGNDLIIWIGEILTAPSDIRIETF
jgi:hypothetical protein